MLMLLHLMSSVLAISTVRPDLREPLASVRRVIPFPRRVLSNFLGDAERARPGTKIESPPFEAAGCRWQVSLYPFGGNADPELSGRVGCYLKLLQTEQEEVDATFKVRMHVLSKSELADAAEHGAPAAGQRGLPFRCGMTFCRAAEAGLSVGRCEDWGAHVYPTDLLLAELEATPDEYAPCVEVELSVWSRRRCEAGASLAALAAQVRRLPEGSLRVGEVFVALASSGEAKPLVRDGIEYRVMRLLTAAGDARFDTQGDDVATAWLVPTLKDARAGAVFESNERNVRAALAADPSGRFFADDRGGDWTGLVWADEAAGQRRLPVAVSLASLPPLASRLGLRALPARLGFAARSNLPRLLLFLLIGASPLWAGYLLSQLGSAYVIPSRSMEGTLRVGDVVLAEKASRLLSLPYEAGDLVLFSPPPGLTQLVSESGGRLDARDLFVKRIAAVGGDTVELLPSGGIAVNGVARAPAPLACEEPPPPPLQGSEEPTSGGEKRRVIPAGSLFVLGDCPARSTDSRKWGVLPTQNVVARPVVRIWPPERTGAIDETVDLNPFRREAERAAARDSRRAPGE